MEANIQMNNLIAEFPNNLSQAMEIANQSSIQKPGNEIKNVVICGMGGSGIGGKIVAQWLVDDLNVPVGFCQGYSIPKYVNENTLVIASSYSGNTEETIMSVEAAIAKGAHVIGITSGGKLAEICKEKSFDYILVPGGNPPRTALAFSLVQLVNVFHQLGMCPAERLEELKKAKDLIVQNEESIKQEAKTIAASLKDKIPVVYATDSYEALAVRVRQQLNENSKKIGWSSALPEMNHNELVGWGGGDDRFGVVFLDSKDLIERNQKRLDISLNRLKDKTDTVIRVEAKGDSKIERTIYLNCIMDWVSLFLAEINNVDSIEIEIINYLKGSLAKI